MKKIFLLITFILILFCFSCSSKKNVKKIDLDEKEVTREKLKPKIVILSGKVEIYPQNDETEVYIVENWKTRSRVTYKVINYKNHKRILDLNEKIVKVKVSLLEKSSPWTGKVNLLEILEIIKED